MASWLAAGASACAAGLAVQSLASGTSGVVQVAGWAPDLGIDVSFRFDALTLPLAAMVAGIGAIIVHFCGHYFGPGDKRRTVIATLSLFEAAMLGVVLSDNLYLLFIFWELTGLCSFFLIATDADKDPDAPVAAKQALLVTVGGALPMLVGFVYLADVAGTASLSQLATTPPAAGVMTIALALILPGVFTKSAQFPFHFWLPGAMAAPTPISAYLHSATMVKAGVILMLFLYPVLGQSWLWTAALVPAGAVTLVWGSYQALRQDDIKILMAWSTVAQLGLLFVTIGIGSPLAIRAAVMHVFAHAVFKAALFLVVGVVYHETHTRLLSRLGGLKTVMPVLHAGSLVCAASMAGIPPMAGFLSKEIVVEGALHSDGWIRIAALAAIVAGSVGTVWYSARFHFGIFTGTMRGHEAEHAHAPHKGAEAGVMILAGLSLLMGLGAGLTGDWLLNPAVATLSGAPEAVSHLALWHGLTPPLFVSAGIIGLGLLLHHRSGFRELPGRFRVAAAETFEVFLDSCKAAGGFLNGIFSAANPAIYFGSAVLIGFAGSLAVIPDLNYRFEVESSVTGWSVILIQVLAIAGVFAIQNRLARVLLLSAVGFSVAVIYRLFRAPDLMLTQVLVEVLLTVFVALAIRFLPAGKDPGWERPGMSGAFRSALALAAGVAAFSLVIGIFGVPQDMRLPEYFIRQAPAVSGGNNIVNVIIVDIRGLDTLVETFVIIAAALGVAGLLRRREVEPAAAVEEKAG